MNDDDDSVQTLQFVAQDTEVLPYDDGLETVQELALLPNDEDEDPTTQIAISGEITI